MMKSTVSQVIRVNQWPKTKHTHNPKDESINWLASSLFYLFILSNPSYLSFSTNPFFHQGKEKLHGKLGAEESKIKLST